MMNEQDLKNLNFNIKLFYYWLLVLTFAVIALFFTGCSPVDVSPGVKTKTVLTPKKYRRVVSISHETKTYVVTTSTQTGGNEIKRGAGGAILGGGIDMLLGGSGGGGAVVGGLLGAATTKNPQVESYQEQRTDVIYTIVFDNGSVEIRNNYLPFAIGDSLEIY